MRKEFKDCFVSYGDGVFTIGNSKIERQIKIKDGIPVSMYLKSGENIWETGNFAMFNPALFDFKNAITEADFYVSDFEGESEEALVGELLYKTDKTTIKQVFYIFPDTPAVSLKLYLKGKAELLKEETVVENTAVELNKFEISEEPVLPPYGVCDAFNMNEDHIKMDAVRLFDETDKFNELVCHDKRILYGRPFEDYKGSIFILDNFVKNKALMLVSEGYVSGKKFAGDKDFSVNHKKAAFIYGNGVSGEYKDFTYVGGSTAVCGKKEDVASFYKAYYRKMYNAGEMYIMSNTWGDRNRDTAVCEEFILKEIDMAHTLGVDIVQIDDGWQKGASANSGFVTNGAWGSFYETDRNFWDVNKERFPRGFSVITDYAKEKGIKLGLWFSMDKDNGYERWEQDAKRILELHKKYGVCYFKIDGLVISDHKCEENIFKFVSFLDKESGGKIKFNFDITANRRYGYFMAKQYSTLFVENRYTDWGNYYPHTTLRNLWGLSEYIPSSKMQFEVLNQYRNKDKYKDDPLGPSTYPSDYLFASVMVANPLIWMEMSHLSDKQTQELKSIISVYKKERENILKGEVFPIGERPDGYSYTGFEVISPDKNYLILLKEKSEETGFTYNLKSEITEFSILKSNCPDAEIILNKNQITVKGMEKSGYIFLSY